MRIVHLSYVYVSQYDDPNRFLKRISFFTGIVQEMARHHEVSSIHCINYSGVLKVDGATYHFLKLNRWQIIFPLRYHHYIKTLKPEVIIIHGLLFPWQVLWLRLQLGGRVKLFAQHHAERPLRFHKKFLQRLADKVIQGYFFTSLGLGKKWIEAGQISNAEKMHEVMEVSSSFFRIDSAKAKQKVRINGDPVYLWVGRLNSNKDPETLLRAFVFFSKIDTGARLYVIYQDDELLSTVKELSRQRPAEIKLIGKIEHDDLLYWYNAADFIISTSHYESGGTAVCEAMSCGCIPILSDIPSFRTITQNGSVGLLYKPGDYEDLKNVLIKSTSVKIDDEKERVIAQFQNNLSFDAISKKILTVISNAF